MGRFPICDISKLLAEPLTKKIDLRAVESWAASYWDIARSKRVDELNSARPFVMMFPPPNITGSLHLGHALTGAVQDALIRQRRMEGYECRFIPGFDHAGLATQSIVEKLLYKQRGISRKQLGRDQFLDLVYEWKEKKLTDMRTQLSRLGLDLDLDREYFTMDSNSSFAVQAAFKQLFNKGLIYRANKEIFWCDSLQTTLSDIEVEKVDGHHRYIRSGEIVERRFFSQWFVDAQAVAKRAVAVVEDNSIEMIPPNYKRSWSSWLMGNGIEDWCISRQSWWGHRIPAYKASSASDIGENWVVADSHEEAKTKLGLVEDVNQDPDVLDTWFSSSLLPLTVSGWPDKTAFAASCRSQHFPMHVMETGFDILTYWVSKMVMISLALTDQVPFKLVLLHGMICDSDGKKMSKSLGNVIDPLDVVDGATLSQLQARTKEAHSLGIIDSKQLPSVLDKQKKLFPKGISTCGADGLRAYLLSHDVQKEVVRVQIQQIEKIRRLTNKIWNLFRLLFAVLDRQASNGSKVSLQMDLSILHKLELDHDDQQVLFEMSECVDKAFQSFHHTYLLHHCFVKLETFINEHLSHIYVEQIKTAIMSSEETGDGHRKLEVLATCLLTSIKLIHPFMPHLSEFLFQKLIRYSQARDHVQDKDEVRLLCSTKFPEPEDWTEFSRKPSPPTRS